MTGLGNAAQFLVYGFITSGDGGPLGSSYLMYGNPRAAWQPLQPWMPASKAKSKLFEISCFDRF